MGLFGNKEKKAAKQEALRQELARLDALPIAQLAEEVLRRLWADGSATNDRRTPTEIEREFAPVTGLLGQDNETRDGVKGIALEGVFALEGAGLLKHQFENQGANHISQMYFKITRQGQAALADGSVAQRVEAVPAVA